MQRVLGAGRPGRREGERPGTSIRRGRRGQAHPTCRPRRPLQQGLRFLSVQEPKRSFGGELEDTEEFAGGRMQVSEDGVTEFQKMGVGGGHRSV